MAKKSRNSDEYQQLSLLDTEKNANSEAAEDDWLSGDFGFDSDNDRTVETQEELLTLKLLREAIKAQNPGDTVMADFAEYVLPNLLRIAIGVTAKGGKFFDEIDQQRAAEGKSKVRRDNAADQSLNTHLLNGLFPTNLIEKRLETLALACIACLIINESRLNCFNNKAYRRL